MQVLITGATGLIGQQLVNKLREKSHSITILTRNPDKAKRLFGSGIHYCQSLDSLQTLNGFDAVINLAGEPIANKRWSDKQKRQLCESRWQITQRLSQLIKKSDAPPNVFISGSAIGFYGAQSDNLLTEQSKPHNDFTHQLCERWEALALDASSSKTRVCLLRTAVVLDKDGGALAKMLPPFRLGLGGVIGSGQQYMAWIHIQDMVEAIYFILVSENLSGPFNLCSPNAVTNKQFSNTLANVLKRPCVVPVPACALKFIMGEVSTVILDGQRAIPEKLQRAGFKFNYPTLNQALVNLLT